MDEAVERALAQDLVIDITTTGRQSGKPSRVEIWFHRVDGHYLITGRPGPRSWYANLLANPALTFHLKESAQADLPARARAVTEVEEKRRLLAGIERIWKIEDVPPLEEWVSGSPLVEVVFEEGGG